MTASCRSAQDRINECQGLVRSLAAGIRRKLPPHVELDDLIAYGQVGLAEAAHEFDPSRGSRFSTYAYYRIRGAIYDGLAKMSWLSRSQYKQARYEQMANEVLCVENQGEVPAAEENDLRWFGNLSRAVAVVYLSTRGSESQNEASEQLADSSSLDPFRVATGREISQKLHELIDALPEEPGTLVRATFFEGLTLQEAAERLKISKSWASRLLAKTLQQLARSLTLLGVAN
jgi:RNA polymerase sigma factor for flagellar operon FliA